MLPCVAVFCSVLQCVAVCCSVLQYVAVCCSALQCIASSCSVMQCELNYSLLRRCYSELKMSRGGLPLSTSKGIFGFPIFSLDTDNFTARDPWIWRWLEETRAIPHRQKLKKIENSYLRGFELHRPSSKRTK